MKTGRRGAVALAVAVAVLLVSSIPVLGATSQHDPTFGVEGVAAPALPAPAPASKAGIIDLAAASDGGVYAALTGLARPTYFGIVRLDETGQPDASFGSVGYTARFVGQASFDDSPAPSETGSEAEAVAVQPDGKIIAVGATGFRAFIAEDGNTLEVFSPLLVRYLPNGSLDPSFGDGGSVTPQVSEPLLRDVAVTAEGRILAVAGAVYAFRPDGFPDRTFGKDGRASIGPRRGLGNDLRAISLLPDGGFLVAGYRHSRRLLLTRLKSDGSPDRSFGGGDGIATVGIPDRRCCGRAALAVGPDGQTVVAVNAGASRPRVFLARFGRSGGRDRTFGDDGLLALPYRFAKGYALAVASDGGVYAAGLVEAGGRAAGPFAYSVARISSQGELERSFGKAGIETVRQGEVSIAGAALTLPDGRVLVGGSYAAKAPNSNEHRTTLLLTRFTSTG